MVTGRQTISGAMLASLSIVLSSLVLFFLYKIMVLYLSPAYIGLWSLVLATTSTAKLSELGFSGGVVKFVAKYSARRELDKAADIVQTAVTTLAIFVGLVVISVYPVLRIVLEHLIPQKYLPDAYLILPWSLLSLWTNTVAGVAQSAVDGCQRVAFRIYVFMACQLIFALFAVILIRVCGLVGLAIAQFLQAVSILIGTWIVTLRLLPDLPVVPTKWHREAFKEIFAYSVNFQINAIFQLLFDPITKALMTKFGGLSTTGYYEMGSQLVQKSRQIIVSGYRALVPYIAHTHELSPDKVADFYIRCYRMLFVLAIPYFGLLAILVPLISYVWVGKYQPEFEHFSWILLLGWGGTLIAVPAYMSNLGIGSLTPNTIGHGVTSVANLILGIVLGAIFGGEGIVISVVFALLLGNAITVFEFHHRHSIPMMELLPKDSWLLLGCGTLAVGLYFLVLSMVVGAGSGIYGIAKAGTVTGNLLIQGIGGMSFVALMAVVLSVHPLVREVIGKSRIGKTNVSNRRI